MLRTLAVLVATLPPPLVIVDRDNVVIDRSCTIRVTADVIVDEHGDGVIHVSGDDIVVTFEGQPLRGAAAGVAPDHYDGLGIHVTGHNVVLRGARVSGYRIGAWAEDADGFVAEDLVLDDLYRQRLGSTPEAEDAVDWLWPHANDDGEWRTRYGAVLALTRVTGAVVRRITVRNAQNGIILERVQGARIYDNDASYLSGWGLALWRSCGNRVSRNAFDFCVRGYSHGVYNRGQDSAGILMFEQCSGNVFVENSATHGGDGFFAFSGREALGEAAPVLGLDAYRRRGNTDNLIARNDFSYAVAHGLELTFGFGNVIAHNRLAENGICGIWGGYSQQTSIVGNLLEGNGAMGYGRERGAINIEHGRANWITGNVFRRNRCGVALWWDDDTDLLGTPWARANERGARDNVIAGNTFTGDEVAVELRDVVDTWLGHNRYEGVGQSLDADEASRATLRDTPTPRPWTPPSPWAIGDRRPVGARPALAGREHIIMTEWGPHDGVTPALRRRAAAGAQHVYDLLAVPPTATIDVDGAIDIDRSDDRLTVTPRSPDAATRYRIRVDVGATTLVADGAIVPVTWRIDAFAWPADPREDAGRWEQKIDGAVTRQTLDLRFGGGGPADVDAAWQTLPPDRFGVVAETVVTLPAGRWRLVTRSDDGLRVRLDDETVIDDWTWHAPRRHEHVFEVEGTRRVTVRVEHFEIDGHAVLSARLEPAP